jgi:AraC-like DNA-binding protein
MHRQGALLCSACSGVFLLAETGLFDGHDSTVHWAYADVFARTFPAVPLRPEQVLVVSGDREQLVTSGASMTWHDLVLYLIARRAGAVVAQAVARMFALQWHHDGLTSYIVFHGRMDHGDAAIADAQSWLSTHFAVGSPVEEMVRRSGLPERTFKRRFTEATGFARSIMCSGCGSRMPSGGWSEPMPRPTRSAGRSAMRTPPFSAGCSNAQLASHQALIVDAFKSLVCQFGSQAQPGLARPPANHAGTSGDGELTCTARTLMLLVRRGHPLRRQFTRQEPARRPSSVAPLRTQADSRSVAVDGSPTPPEVALPPKIRSHPTGNVLAREHAL